MSSDELTPVEAAPILKASTSTLARWRSKGKGPKFMDREGRIFYRMQDILEYKESRVRSQTRAKA